MSVRHITITGVFIALIVFTVGLISVDASSAGAMDRGQGVPSQRSTISTMSFSGVSGVSATTCQTPASEMTGSFIVSTSSWMNHLQRIKDQLAIQQVTAISGDYLRVDADPATPLSAMTRLQRMGVEITLNAPHEYSQAYSWYKHGPQPYTPGTPSYTPPIVASGIPSSAAMRPAATTPPAATTVTIDTGVVAGADNPKLTHQSIGGDSANVDIAAPDLYTGHGPAIADLIGDMAGMADQADQRKSWLKEADYTRGLQQRRAGAMQGPRTLDTASLLASLDRLPADTEVVNLSLGAPTCANESTKWTRTARGRTAVQIDPIRQWIIDNPQITVVAAAGNGASDIRTYPAAWTLDPAVRNIISVGSMSEDGTRSCFSNHGAQVDYYAVGEKVLVQHPTEGAVIWTGTSFAAPQVTAAIAAGLPPEAVATHRSLVPAPSAQNLELCS